jgi:hypothetical protein
MLLDAKILDLQTSVSRFNVPTTRFLGGLRSLNEKHLDVDICPILPLRRLRKSWKLTYLRPLTTPLFQPESIVEVDIQQDYLLTVIV